MCTHEESGVCPSCGFTPPPKEPLNGPSNTGLHLEYDLKKNAKYVPDCIYYMWYRYVDKINLNVL